MRKTSLLNSLFRVILLRADRSSLAYQFKIFYPKSIAMSPGSLDCQVTCLKLASNQHEERRAEWVDCNFLLHKLQSYGMRYTFIYWVVEMDVAIEALII